MAWEGVVSEARKWACGSTLGFTVTAIDEGSKKISFSGPLGSFYATVPEKIGLEEWVRVRVN